MSAPTTASGHAHLDAFRERGRPVAPLRNSGTCLVPARSVEIVCPGVSNLGLDRRAELRDVLEQGLMLCRSHPGAVCEESGNESAMRGLLAWVEWFQGYPQVNYLQRTDPAEIISALETLAA